MEDAEEAKVAAFRTEIDGLQDGSISQLPFDLFEKPGNRTTKLIATSGQDMPIDGRHRWHDFKFRESVLVTRVTVYLTGYSDFSDFDIRWFDELGVETQARGRPTDGVLVFYINSLCTHISFRPPTVFFSSPKISNVRVEGVERSKVASALDSLSDLDTYKENIIRIADKAVASADAKIELGQKSQQERASIQREIATMKGNQSRLKKNVDDLSLKRNELITHNSAAESALADADARIKINQNQNTALIDENKLISEEIVDGNIKLKDLRANINLFPSEIVSFVDQGTKNLRQYFLLAAAPIIIIVAMFILLIRGAADLTTVITNDPKVNIQALMISRVPYVTISIAIITACYKIARVRTH
ncbi:MAG: hypothetical protein ABI898_04770 [Sphingomonadales bacterium]